MAGSPKVLTVSCGTVICRLEGFQDAPDALAAVAELVRELAARAEGPRPEGETQGGDAGEGRSPAADPRAHGDVEANLAAFESALRSGSGEGLGAQGVVWVDEDEEDLAEPQAMRGVAALWAGTFDEPPRSPPVPAPRTGWADEAAVSRLLAQADAQLAEPEAVRRRASLAQLRAAVAATEAARRLGEARFEEGRREEPFRDDLRQAVATRRAGLAWPG